MGKGKGKGKRVTKKEQRIIIAFCILIACYGATPIITLLLLR